MRQTRTPAGENATCQIITLKFRQPKTPAPRAPLRPAWRRRGLALAIGAPAGFVLGTLIFLYAIGALAVWLAFVGLLVAATVAWEFLRGAARRAALPGAIRHGGY